MNTATENTEVHETLIDEFFWLLQTHDWTFEYAEGGAYRRGEEQQKVLFWWKNKHPLFAQMYQDYFDFIWKKSERPSIENYKGK